MNLFMMLNSVGNSLSRMNVQINGVIGDQEFDEHKPRSFHKIKIDSNIVKTDEVFNNILELMKKVNNELSQMNEQMQQGQQM